MSSGTDVPAIPEPYASKLIEYGALSEGADFLRDPQEDQYRQLAEMWMRKFRQHLNRRNGAHSKSFEVSGLWQWMPSDPSVDIRAIY